jgi:hypothetical protein
MFCSKCGKQIDTEALICVHCGVGTEKYRQEQRVAQEALTATQKQPQPSYQQPQREVYQQAPLVPGRFFILIPSIIWLSGDVFSFFNPSEGSIIQLSDGLYIIEGMGGSFVQFLFLLVGLFLSLIFILGIVFHKNLSKGELLRKLGTTAIIICVINGVVELIANGFNGFGWLMFFLEGLNVFLCALFHKGAKKNEEAYAYAYINASNQNGTTALQRLAASSNYVDDYKVASEWWTCTGCGKQYPPHTDSCENCIDEIPDL